MSLPTRTKKISIADPIRVRYRVLAFLVMAFFGKEVYASVDRKARANT